MNTTMTEIVKTTKNDKVLENAVKLMSAGNRKVKVQFLKKDGTLRDMIVSLRSNWNTMNGFNTTKSGLEMLKTKIGKGMATVTEWLEGGVFQPRTLNLATITKMEIL